MLWSLWWLIQEWTRRSKLEKIDHNIDDQILDLDTLNLGWRRIYSDSGGIGDALGDD